MFKLSVIACGNKMPDWVEIASLEYMKRLKEYVQINLIEIPLIKRGKGSDLSRIIEKEAAQIIAAIPVNTRVIALQIEGKTFSSEQLALHINQLQQHASHICVIIGGPEGLSTNVLRYCQESWSLSKLTLPHPLVRICLLETIYRSFAINHNHPYHK